MKKWLVSALCLLSSQSYAAVQCFGDGVELTLEPHTVKVVFEAGGEFDYSYNRISTEVSPFTKVTTYHLITRLDASLVVSEKINNSRIPNCGRRTTCDSHFPLSYMNAKFHLQGLDYFLSCHETL